MGKWYMEIAAVQALVSHFYNYNNKLPKNSHQTIIYGIQFFESDHMPDSLCSPLKKRIKLKYFGEEYAPFRSLRLYHCFMASHIWLKQITNTISCPEERYVHCNRFF